jgi:hypothetical protein
MCHICAIPSPSSTRKCTVPFCPLFYTILTGERIAETSIGFMTVIALRAIFGVDLVEGQKLGFGTTVINEFTIVGLNLGFLLH